MGRVLWDVRNTGRSCTIFGAPPKENDREALKKEFEDHKETLTIRIKAIQKQEKALGERFEDLQGKIQAALGGGPQAG